MHGVTPSASSHGGGKGMACLQIVLNCGVSAPLCGPILPSSDCSLEQPSAEDEVRHSVRIVAGAGILNPAPNDYLQRWPV